MPNVTRIADGVHFVTAHGVNWTILTEGEAVTLVDAGYPAYAPLVVESLRRIGHRPEQVEAVLVTHGHVDHIGGVPAILALAPGASVLTSAAEAPHVRREFLEQATPLDVAANLWRPGMLGWTAHIVRAGALRRTPVPSARPFPAPGPLDVPGRPVPVPSPGHTTGHTCYHLPDAGALITGDALITGHPLVRGTGPRLLPAFFHHDLPAAGTTFERLRAYPAETFLPGHGAPWRP